MTALVVASMFSTAVMGRQGSMCPDGTYGHAVGVVQLTLMDGLVAVAWGTESKSFDVPFMHATAEVNL
jgi:hypothetical protein